MAAQRKTYDTFEIRGDYGQGFELVTTELTWYSARKAKANYINNEPGRSFKIVTVRERYESDAHRQDIDRQIAEQRQKDSEQRKQNRKLKIATT